MNDKSNSKVDTKIETKELMSEAFKDEELGDKDLDEVTGGYLKVMLKDCLKSDGNEKTGVSGRKASSGWDQGDWTGDGSISR